MTLRHLIFLVLFYLGGGVFISFGFLRHKDVGSRYFRIHGLGLSAILFFSYLFLGQSFMDQELSFWFVLFLVCTLGFSLFTGVSHRLSAASFFLGVISFFGLLVLDIQQFDLGGESTKLIFNSVLASLTLGFSLSAMMLGHWYLIEPKLSISELKRITLFMIIWLGLRFFFASYEGIFLLRGLTELEIYRYLVKVPGVFVLMRYVWGILASLILSFLVWRTLLIRSTQSATGILYVIVVACLVGEILSVYLAFYFGITV